jgi:outer membrane lipoprotein SlyB
MNKALLSKLSAETFSQMAVNGDISDNFSKGLTTKFLNLGVTTVLAGMMALSSGVAHADDTRTGAITLSGIWGVMTNGSKPKDIPVDCQVRGTSGMKTGGAGAVGGWLGSKVGDGSGQKWATVAGAVIGVTAAQTSENDRMRKECAEQMTYNKMVNGVPMYATNNSQPQSPILYEGRTVNGRSFYVTMQDSPGIAGLAGKVNGGVSVDSDPIVRNAMEKGSELLAMSYANLDKEAREYNQIASGRTSIAKLSRYAVDANDVGNNSELNRTHQAMIAQAKKEFDMAYSEYSRRRSVFANVADNAVVDGFDIARYGKTLEYFMPPESATVTYNGRLSNSYAVIPAPARP